MKTPILKNPADKRRKQKSSAKSVKALKLNVVLFEPFRDAMEISFYDRNLEDPFSDEPPAYELNGNHLPNELGMEMDRDEYLHTRYAAEPGAPYTVSVDPQTTNFLFLKAYGFQKIANYFINEVPGVVVENNFVNQLIVWVESGYDKNGQVHPSTCYERYQLDFNMGRYSGNRKRPELLISYLGESKVLDVSLADFKEEHSMVNKVVTADGRCVRLKAGEVQRQIRPEACHPVLNYVLKKRLKIPFYAKRVQNKYKDQRKKISVFYLNFLDTTKFRRETGLLPEGFFEPDPKQISKEDLNRHPMRFGGRNMADTVYKGLYNHGPFRGAPHSAPWFLIVAPEESYQLFKQKVVTPLIEGHGYYPGMPRFVHMTPIVLKQPVLYTDLENPEEEVIRKLSEYRFPDGKGAVLFCSSISKDEPNHHRMQQFFRIKEYLLERGIVSQAFDAENVRQTSTDNIGWWHQHVSTALLAKLGGIPWVTGESRHKELIIGVSAYKPEWSTERYTGSAFSFDNTGYFRGFDFFEGEDIRYFCGAVKKALRMFIREHGSEATERVVIHFYKQLKGRDLWQVMNVMRELDCEVPVYLVVINKTFNQQEIAVDGGHASRMPLNGTYIHLHGGNYLLFNNERTDALGEKLKNYPFPIKLSIRQIEKGVGRGKKMSDSKKKIRREPVPDDVVNELMAQIIRFSRMYWKSANPQPLPVTIAYSDLLARQVCWFSNKKVPAAVRRVPFFL